VRLRQVYYTSSIMGLRDSKGFQVHAATPGLPPYRQEQIERLSAYAPPLSAPTMPSCEEMERLPLCLQYRLLPGGAAVLAQIKYTGQDYSGRFGNYFAHSILLEDPATELSGNLPVEMWRSSIWAEHEVKTTELPYVETLAPGTVISPTTVHAFCAAEGLRRPLEVFLTAIGEALRGGRRVVILETPEIVAFWIALASYVLPRAMTLVTTFSTYAKDPFQSDALIVGSSRDSDFALQGAEFQRGFSVFDFAAGRLPQLRESSAFARQAAQQYAAGGAPILARFPGFAATLEKLDGPQDLDGAFALFVANQHLDLEDEDALRALRFASSRNLVLDVTTTARLIEAAVRGPAEEAVPLCLAAYEAAQRVAHGAELRSALDAVVIPWLVSALASSPPTRSLGQLVQCLQPPTSLRTPSLTTGSVPLWGAAISKSADKGQSEILVQTAERLGYLNGPPAYLQTMGEFILGPAIANPALQAWVSGRSEAQGARSLLEGIGAYLATKAREPELFTNLGTLLRDPATRKALEEYAMAHGATLLYMRLAGSAHAASETRGERLARLCHVAEQVSGAPSAADLEVAYETVWSNTSPSAAEALAIVAQTNPDLLLHTRILSGLVETVSQSMSGSLDLESEQLAAKLCEPSYSKGLNAEELAVLKARVIMGSLRRPGMAARDALENLLTKWRDLQEAPLKERVRKFAIGQLLEVDALHTHVSLLQRLSEMDSEFLQQYVKSITGSPRDEGSPSVHDVARLFAIRNDALLSSRGDETMASALDSELQDACARLGRRGCQQVGEELWVSRRDWGRAFRERRPRDGLLQHRGWQLWLLVGAVAVVTITVLALLLHGLFVGTSGVRPASEATPTASSTTSGQPPGEVAPARSATQP